MPSRVFGERSPVHPHLVRNDRSGMGGEVADLRADVEEAFLQQQAEASGTTATRTALGATLTATDAGKTFWDTTVAALYTWTGSAWSTAGGTVVPTTATSTTAVNGSETATNNAETATNQVAASAVLVDLGSPSAESDTAVHAAYGGDQVVTFPGPITSPDVPRNVKAVFGVGWDGGDIQVTGTDQFDVVVTETLTVAVPTGVKIFKTVTGIVKTAVGSDPATASVGIGKKLGITPATTTAFGMLTADGVGELGTWDGTYSAVTPTTAPGGVAFGVMVMANHTHVQNSHNHTQSSHNHTQTGHTHTLS